jgi:hypothetical protein
MTEADAEERGRAAFRDGRPGTPLADPAMYAELKGARVGEKTHLMVAFSRGWHDENFRT